jgi:hypothetical protein
MTSLAIKLVAKFLQLLNVQMGAQFVERQRLNMRASRGMGAVMPSKMPKKKEVTRKDNPDQVDFYKEGGKVNAAGNYTKPSLRKRIVSQVKAAATHGTGAGQWSARKAQLVAKKYKAAGGGYK